MYSILVIKLVIVLIRIAITYTNDNLRELIIINNRKNDIYSK